MLGTGTPIADPERSGPAVAIIYRGRAYLFDSGPGVVRRAAAAAARLNIPALQAPNLNRVFLTHLHSDHTLGLPDLIFSPWVLGRQGPLDIYGPKGTKAMSDHLEAAWKQDIDVRLHGLEHANATGYQVMVHEVEAGVIFRENGLEVSAIPVHHGSWAQARLSNQHARPVHRDFRRLCADACACDSLRRLRCVSARGLLSCPC